MNKYKFTSLSTILDGLDSVLFDSGTLPTSEMKQIIDIFAQQHNQENTYRGLFAPTAKDLSTPLILYSGNKIKTRAAKMHILSEEIMRILNLVAGKVKGAKDLLNKTNSIFEAFIFSGHKQNGGPIGRYCCRPCSVAMWRHMTASTLPLAEKILMSSKRLLKEARLDNGRWHGYPFYYTLLTLLDFPEEMAKQEFNHAAPACERTVRKNLSHDKYKHRQRAICMRVLEHL